MSLTMIKSLPAYEPSPRAVLTTEAVKSVTTEILEENTCEKDV